MLVSGLLGLVSISGQGFQLALQQLQLTFVRFEKVSPSTVATRAHYEVELKQKVN